MTAAAVTASTFYLAIHSIFGLMIVLKIIKNDIFSLSHTHACLPRIVTYWTHHSHSQLAMCCTHMVQGFSLPHSGNVNS